MEEIKVRKLQKGTLARLSEIAKKKGFESREDFMREVVEQLAAEHFVFETEVRYQLLVTQYNQMQEWTVDQIVSAISTLLVSRGVSGGGKPNE